MQSGTNSGNAGSLIAGNHFMPVCLNLAIVYSAQNKANINQLRKVIIMSKFIEATIQGQNVTATSHKATLATIASIDQSITIAANYAAFLLLAHNGPDKLNDLIRMDHFRTQVTGKINATGKQVINYIRKFAPIIHFDSAKETFSFKRFTGKNATEKKNELLGVFNLKGEKLTGYDFPMTFREFVEMEKPKKDGNKKAFNADRLATIADQAMEAIADGTFALADDSEALDKLMQLQAAMITLITERQAIKEKIAELDKMRVLELAKLKPSAREKAAN